MSLDTTLTLLLNGSDYPWLDNFAFCATKITIWLPLYLAMACVVVYRFGWKKGLLAIVGAGLCVLIADQVASGICKPLFERLRPTHEPTLEGLIDIVNGYRGGRYGFFSSHAANTFAIATFLTLLLRHRATAIALYLWALLNCWTRVYLGVHYVGDLLTGILFGLFTGWLVARLYRVVIARYAWFADSHPLASSSAPLANTLANLIPIIFLASLFRIAFIATSHI